MKKSMLANVLFILVVAIAAIVLNWYADVPEKTPDTSFEGNSADYVLAVTWHSAFCEKLPRKPECQLQGKAQNTKQGFSLHGLWPQPRGNVYCGMSGRLVNIDKSGQWQRLPELDLTKALRKELAQKMPGYRSGLHRHEWYKHGTCMKGGTPQLYFEQSLHLLDALNTSGFVRFISRNIGNKLTFKRMEAEFVKSFGSAAKGRFLVDCYRDGSRRIIQEIRLSLRGDASTQELKSMLAAGKSVGRSCPSGIVDEPGLQ